MQVEPLDLDKLRSIFRNNFIWILFIVVATNLGAYLYLRYTKNLYEAASELKLDIKQDATELGIMNLAEPQNLNVISGEIEQIKSRLFLNRVIDSLDLWVSYHSIGKVLTDEMYRRSPFVVEASNKKHSYLNVPINFNFTSSEGFNLSVHGQVIPGRIGQKVKLNDVELVVRKTPVYDLYHEDDYFFILHSRENLLGYLALYTRVEPLNYEANTIRVSFQDYNPLKASVIVNTIDSTYLMYSNEQKNLTNKQKISWLDGELAQVEKKMEDYEDYFENFTLQNKSNNLNLELQKTINALYSIDSQRFQLNKRITDAAAVAQQVSSNNFEVSYSRRLSLPAYLNEQINELLELVQEREKLSLSYHENTMAFKQKEQQLETLRNQVYRQIDDVRKEWEKNLTELNRRKSNLEQQFAGMPDKNTQYSKNQRFYKLYEEFYLAMMQSKAEFEIAQAGSTPDFKILASAIVPTDPISPKKILVHGIGLSSGVVLSILFVALLYIANNKVTSVQEIERVTQVPVLGVIPESNHTSQTPFHVIDNPRSMVSESIRTLRTNLDFFSVPGKGKSISISSTIAGEGKSFLALNLGGVMAMSKKKVVLLDLDMRKPKTNIPFGIPDSQKGVSTALIKKYDINECIVPTGVDNFDYIPSGPHPPNPSELLMNGDFTRILDTLKEKYEIVIIDTPPVGLVTDGIMAMKKTDVTIYVIRANYSTKDFIHNLKRLQFLHKLTNISVVLNALPSNNKMYGYGYYADSTPRKKSWKNLFKAS